MRRGQGSIQPQSFAQRSDSPGGVVGIHGGSAFTEQFQRVALPGCGCIHSGVLLCLPGVVRVVASVQMEVGKTMHRVHPNVSARGIDRRTHRQ